MLSLHIFVEKTCFTIKLPEKVSLEIPLLLKSSCPEQKTFQKTKNFVDDHDYRVNDEESSDEEEAAIVIETDQSKLVSYTDSSREKEEEDLHVDINFDEPIDLAIN